MVSTLMGGTANLAVCFGMMFLLVVVKKLVEPRGVEPLTSAMRTLRSTN